jgi:hypothetical protein
MTQHKLQARFGAVVFLVLAAALLRLLPHPPNFTPVAAMALFAGAKFDRARWAFVLPLFAMLLSDIALEALHGYGLHRHIPVVYLCLIATAGIGILLRNRRGVIPTASASVIGSLAFFAATNFSVWALESFYAHTAQGLVACYVSALPFLWPTMIGSLAYTGLLFGGFALAERLLPILAPIPTRIAIR